MGFVRCRVSHVPYTALTVLQAAVVDLPYHIATLNPHVMSGLAYELFSPSALVPVPADACLGAPRASWKAPRPKEVSSMAATRPSCQTRPELVCQNRCKTRACRAARAFLVRQRCLSNLSCSSKVDRLIISS